MPRAPTIPMPFPINLLPCCRTLLMPQKDALQQKLLRNEGNASTLPKYLQLWWNMNWRLVVSAECVDFVAKVVQWFLESE